MSEQSKPNWREARRFVELVAGTPDPIVTFQVIHDPGTKPALAEWRHGKLSDVKYIQKWLVVKIKKGCGVYVTVCRCDGGGRRRENVKAARACFIDLDGKPLPTNWVIQPDIILETSSARFHIYWLIEPTADLNAWSDCQARLAAYYGSDPSVVDPPRVMRLPGFDHLKHKPFRCRILEAIEPAQARLGSFLRRSLQEIAGAHPCEYRKPEPALEKTGFELAYQASPRDLVYARHFLCHARPSIEGQRGNITALGVANRLLDYGVLPEQALQMMESWNDRCQPPWSGQELERIVRNAARYRKTPIGSKTLKAIADDFKESCHDR